MSVRSILGLDALDRLGSPSFYAFLASSMLICIPLAYTLAHPLGYGVHGLLWGLFGGLGVASILLLGRFFVLSRREIRPF